MHLTGFGIGDEHVSDWSLRILSIFISLDCSITIEVQNIESSATQISGIKTDTVRMENQFIVVIASM